MIFFISISTDINKIIEFQKSENYFVENFLPYLLMFSLFRNSIFLRSY
jgi:hypothetical protein